MSRHLGPVLGLVLGIALAWADEAENDPGNTYRLLMRRIAYACRYGHAAAFVWEMDRWMLADFCEAIGGIVEEENAPR